MGLEHNAIIVRPAFYVCVSGGDRALFDADDLGGLARRLRAFVGAYAQEA